ncbi:hypothetical protein [Promicromonospora sp. MEB111]|uniref:hypothetical protein n=1 Tax=Promicromonospora sp. MEB111 TaxID=3040301 RepID=UPI00254B99A8|nr:hypothetical protein [Promicromonospora sp. MEB111]
MTTPETSTTGTPRALASSWEWRLDLPEGWLEVPGGITGASHDLAAWERGATAVVRESLEPVPDESGTTVELDDDARAQLDQLAAISVANLREFADGMAPGDHRVVAALGVMGRGPVPVLVAVGTSDPAAPDDDLMAALGATGGYPAAPPTVEYPDMPDGDGVRVIRLDIGEESGGAWMSVGLGRRTEHPDAVVDTVLVWRTQDLVLGAVMVELLDQLMPTVRIDRTAA